MARSKKQWRKVTAHRNREVLLTSSEATILSNFSFGEEEIKEDLVSGHCPLTKSQGGGACQKNLLNKPNLDFRKSLIQVVL